MAEDIEILKVAHHGSHTSTTEIFLDAFSPEIALISAGRGNRFGHPAGEVIQRLDTRGILISWTDRMNTLRVMTDGKRVEPDYFGPEDSDQE